ncbi:CaiB/BaiF CoA transferase family protein [Leucobacter denitrificans]|uniref:CoA transferase n=1 Tax=Leucobacter denitrificans TaxID=683042 RepID=A0A7G9S533_9MICO|nr:CaiB/BaiF CoA-transferase family protein [Leucobacter denitrificans]QNN62958.1 CoA transferase [Leucobacter denitrificans]
MGNILEGVKIVELASWTFVPSAGVALADWGADVVKVEDTRGGDPGRALVVGGLTREKSRTGQDFMLELGNRGKRSVGLNLKSEEGLAIFKKLVSEADVFLTNWLPAVLERAKIDLDELRAANPRLIVAQGTGQGTEGPDASAPGFDATAYFARSGYSFSLSAPDSIMPFRQTPALGDLPAGLTLAGGVLGALYHRERTGEALPVEVSLLAQAMWTIAPDITAADFFEDVDLVPKPPLGVGFNAVGHPYKTSDDRWIQLMFLQPDKNWGEFIRRVGLPELAEDERFTPAQNLFKNSQELTDILTAHFAAKPYDYWVETLKDETGAWSPIKSPKEVLDDPQTEANGYFIQNTSENGIQYRQVAPPIRFNKETPAASSAPEYAEHTEQVLLELGYDWPEIISAKDNGVVS